MSDKKEAAEKPAVKTDGLSTWIKEDGSEIRLNNEKATVAAAKANGWKKAK